MGASRLEAEPRRGSGVHAGARTIDGIDDKPVRGFIANEGRADRRARPRPIHVPSALLEKRSRPNPTPIALGPGDGWRPGNGAGSRTRVLT